jgi:hypothetical protein
MTSGCSPCSRRGLLPLAGGDEARAWAAEHDVIDRSLLDRALSGVPAAAACPSPSWRSRNIPLPGERGNEADGKHESHFMLPAFLLVRLLNRSQHFQKT